MLCWVHMFLLGLLLFSQKHQVSFTNPANKTFILVLQLQHLIITQNVIILPWQAFTFLHIVLILESWQQNQLYAAWWHTKDSLMCLFQGVRCSSVPCGEQTGSVSRSAGQRRRGPQPGSREPLSLPGGLSGRELPGHRHSVHPAHPASNGAPQAQSWQTALQRLQVYGQAHQQCVWQEEEICVRVWLQGLGPD